VYSSFVLQCLHPAVCNRPPQVTAADWAAWAALSSAGATAEPAFAQFLCRDGHDAGSLMCSRCLEGFWADGLLCQPCYGAYAALVPLAAAAALAFFAFFVFYRVRVQRRQLQQRQHQHRRSTFGGAPGDEENSTSIVLWFLQVSSTLSMSSQINAARNGQPDSSSLTGLAWLDQLLSFRPWGACMRVCMCAALAR
jgi:hypothetical protein